MYYACIITFYMICFEDLGCDPLIKYLRHSNLTPSTPKVSMQTKIEPHDHITTVTLHNKHNTQKTYPQVEVA